MERQQGNGIYALIGGAAVVVVAALLGVLFWDKPVANGAGQPAGSQPRAENNVPPPKVVPPVDAGKTGPSEKPKDVRNGKAPELPITGGKAPPEKPVADKTHNGDAVIVTDKLAPPPGEKSKPEPLVPPPTIQAPGAENKAAAVAPNDDVKPVEPPKAPAKAGAESKVVFPSFDHVRIEPNGENMFAGRVAPGATVEMIRDGQVYARAVADTSGLFALTAPPLPVGASQIYLQSIAPDGNRESSRESVTVMISRDKAQRPLVALTSPDKPTVVLSNPESPDIRKPEGTDTTTTGKAPGQVLARPDIQIVSVEARDGGRLFVSGHAAPGAAVKLYLNGTMVAPGGADGEGKLSFTIARGMAAGSYLVRLDDVDPVSGQVKSKAEVTFTLPDLSALQAGAGEMGVRPSSPASPTPSPTATRKATVERGDSLWSISERHYGTGYLYLEVYDANMRKIKSPDVIYPGQVLELPPLEVPKDK